MGHASLGIAQKNEELATQAAAFMTEIGYQGIVDSGYRYDARDRSYKILDVNPRVGGNFRQFVSRSGIDVVRALYLDLCGIQVPAGEQFHGRRWIMEDYDLIALVQYRRQGEIDQRTRRNSLTIIYVGSTISRTYLNTI